ncbi:MAG: organomercurial lyase [Acidimicrobiia bacterium]
MSDTATLDEVVRLAIYRGFAETGRPPSPTDLATAIGVSVGEISEAMYRLAADRHLVLDAAGSVLMAHPFATINLGFSVMGSDTLWWGGCAWDSFALPNLVEREPSVLVATTCPGCGAALAWTVTNHAPPAGDEIAHFLTPMAHVWADVVHTCANQRLFCGEGCLSDWLTRTSNSRGYTMDLTTLWNFAKHWYDGRLDSPYTRREPSEAKDYFRQSGLTGPFWGLD